MRTASTPPTLADPAATLLAWPEAAAAGVSVALFAGFDAQERFLIQSTPAESAVAAASTVCLGAGDIGAQVVVAFEGGNTQRPIIVGRLQRCASAAPAAPRHVIAAERLLLQAGRDLELRCGDASIVLTQAGKVLIKGAYVLTRASGANRIKGAYVDIN